MSDKPPRDTAGLVELFKRGALHPDAIFEPHPQAPQPHGWFRSHADLPVPDGHQEHFDKAWDAGWETINAHQNCACDRTVLMWRAVRAVALALLPAQEDTAAAQPDVAPRPTCVDGV